MALSQSSTATSLAVGPPSPRPPLRGPSSKHSRHVAFSELPPKHRSRRRRRDSAADGDCRPCCLFSCAWSCLAIFALVLFVLLFGVLLSTFLHACLPAIAVRSVKFAELEIRNLNSSSSSITASVEFVVEFANKNERVELSVGSLSVGASLLSGTVSLGKSRTGAFSQKPRNTTEVAVSTAVRGAGVNGDDAGELAAGLDGGSGSEAVAINVVLRGKLGFRMGKIDIKGVPVSISCRAVKAEVDHGNKSACNVRIIPV